MSAIELTSSGLDALNRGDNVHAITLFTQATDSGQLSPDDHELALVKRAEAYANQNDYPQAIADVSEATAMNPQDTEASDLLRQLQNSNSQQ